MRRRNLIACVFALFPLNLIARYHAANSLKPGKGFKVAAGEARSGERYKMKGVTFNILDVKITSSDTDGNIAVFEQIGLTPAGGPPLHIHPYQDEWFYVLEGNYLFQVGTDKYQLAAGDMIFLPRQIQHAFVQLTEKGRMVVSYLPAGKMEAFFKVTNEWQTPPSKKEIEKVFEDHDMKVVGPPLRI